MLDFIFRPAVLPHVMLVDLAATKVKQLRPAFNDTLAGLGVGVAAFPGSGNAVAVVTAVGFVDLEFIGILEPTARPVPQSFTRMRLPPTIVDHSVFSVTCCCLNTIPGLPDPLDFTNERYRVDR